MQMFRGRIAGRLALIAALAAMPAAALAQPAADPGEEEYQLNCGGCHGNLGEGGVGPSFQRSSTLRDANLMIIQVLNGGAQMPPLNSLSDSEIATIATYIRSHFGNNFSAVDAATVRGVRNR